MFSRYKDQPWNGLTEADVLELFEGIPEPWSVSYPEAHHIVFSYGEREMLDVTFGTTKITYGTTESVQTMSNRGDSSGYAFCSLHVGENAFSWRYSTNDKALGHMDIYIFTTDNKGNPAIIMVQPTPLSGSTPAYLSFTAWNDTDNVAPTTYEENNYPDSMQTEMCPFVIESEIYEPRYTPYAFWIPITSLGTDTGQLKSDYIPVIDKAKNTLFYNTFTAFS